MIKDIQLDAAIRKIELYEVASYDGRAGRYRLIGSESEYIVLRHDKISDQIILEALIHFEAESVNLYSYASLCEIASRFHCSLTAPRPYAKEPGHAFVRISCLIPYTLHSEVLEDYLMKFSEAINLMRRYYISFLQACELDKVDISMFMDIDLEPARLLYMAEQKEFKFGTWDAFIDSVFQQDELPDSVKEIILPYVDACKKFEEANPDLRLAEVATQLVQLVSEHSREKADKMDIN